jgi:hypothetical protein
MRNKLFLIIVAVLVVGFAGMIIYTKNAKPKEEQIGTIHPDLGQKHIQQGAKHDAYNSSPASSGPHYADTTAPAQWGVYTTELTEEVFIHNEEHGGVVVTYNPDLLPQDQVKKLQALFALPYETKDFQPAKFIVTPRSTNTKPIQLAAWRYTLDLDSYDEAKIKKFYSQRAGKAPEPMAGPVNTPINQAGN